MGIGSIETFFRWVLTTIFWPLVAYNDQEFGRHRDRQRKFYVFAILALWVIFLGIVARDSAVLSGILITFGVFVYFLMGLLVYLDTIFEVFEAFFVSEHWAFLD